MVETTYTQARQHLAALLDRIIDDREIVIVRRRGRDSVAMVAAAELESLLETAHLLRSPKNARRLMSALRRALRRGGAVTNVGELKREVVASRDRH